MTEAIKATLTRAEKYAKRIEVLTKRIETDTAELARVSLEAQTAGRLDSVTTGTQIVARLGRAGSAAVEAAEATYNDDGSVKTPAVAAKAATAGTLRQVDAIVLGVKELEDGSSRYKITFGAGFEQDTDVIQGSQIVSVVA